MNDVLYLDHAATSPPLPEALDAFTHANREAFANPSSIHRAGAAAARVLEKARQDLKAAFGATNYKVVWTATGTEANHLGLHGFAARNRPRPEKPQPKILIGAIEHPCVGETANKLQADGFAVELIPVDEQGRVLPSALQARLDPNVLLVSVQWANNELGSIHPITELVSLTKNLAPDALFHVDAVQAAGKIPDSLDSLQADSVAVAAHKIGGIRGCAAFLLHENAPRPIPTFLGGGHEGGLRSGTENTAGAAAFAAAAQFRRRKLVADPHCYHKRRRALLDGLSEAQVEHIPLGGKEPREQLGSILSVSFPGMLAEVLLHQLEEENILVGSGSACHSSSHDSAALVAIRFPQKFRGSVIRFSFDGSEDLDRLRSLGKLIAAKIHAAASGKT